MALTMDQILGAREFHYGECVRNIGPRGGVKVRQETWRRNGATKTWKTRPNEYRIPITYGYSATQRYGYIENDHNWHAAEDCPLLRGG